MKKIKMLLASALVLTSIFSVGIQNAHADTKTDADTTVVTEQAKEKTAENSVTGKISLHGNASTGYTWQYSVKDTSIAELSEEDSVSDDPTGQLCGAGETHIWDIKGLKEGQTEVTFNYLRPWESEILESKTYIINVDSDLNVTVTEKQGESSSNTGSDKTSEDSTSSSSSTDITDPDSSTTSGSAVVYVVEIKDGNINKYTKNISTDEFKKHFDEVSSYIDEMVKKQQEEMNKFFDLFRSWNF